MTRGVFTVLFCVVLFLPAAHGQERFEGVARVVVVGDFHGGFPENFCRHYWLSA
jgi:hypothetical protein